MKTLKYIFLNKRKLKLMYVQATYVYRGTTNQGQQLDPDPTGTYNKYPQWVG